MPGSASDVGALRVAADGSALRNPSGPAGWCWYLDDRCWQTGGWRQNSNNVAELTAIHELLLATRHLDRLLIIESDSRYAISACSEWIHGWRRRGWVTANGAPVKNAELIQAVAAELEGRQVRFEWVKGHAGHPRQEAADTIARRTATSIADRGTYSCGPGWPSS